MIFLKIYNTEKKRINCTSTALLLYYLHYGRKPYRKKR